MKSSALTRLLSLTVIATLTLLTSPAFAALQTATVTITGSGVRIEGAAASTGATFMTGNRVETDLNSTAQVSFGDTSVWVLEDTRATVTFDASSVRINIECGKVRASSSSAMSYVVTTNGDTNVFVSSGQVSVEAGGSTDSLKANKAERYSGTVTVTSRDAATFEVTTLLCTCRCLPTIGQAAPQAIEHGALGAAAIAAILAGVAAAVIVPIVVINNDDNVGGDLPAISISAFQ